MYMTYSVLHSYFNKCLVVPLAKFIISVSILSTQAHISGVTMFIVLSVDTCQLMYPMMGIQICAVTFSSCFKPDFISYCTERMQSRIPFSVI